MTCLLPLSCCQAASYSPVNQSSTMQGGLLHKSFQSGLKIFCRPLTFFLLGTGLWLMSFLDLFYFVICNHYLFLQGLKGEVHHIGGLIASAN